jgi:hypothetical protein
MILRRDGQDVKGNRKSTKASGLGPNPPAHEPPWQRERSPIWKALGWFLAAMWLHTIIDNRGSAGDEISWCLKVMAIGWVAGPPASAASVLNASGFYRWHTPFYDLGGLRPRSRHRRSPSHVPCKSRRPDSRRLYAGHHLARNTGTRQAHLRDEAGPPISMPTKPFRRLNDDTQPDLPGRALLERLPGPHLTQSSHAFSPVAQHDGLQPTHHRAI